MALPAWSGEATAKQTQVQTGQEQGSCPAMSRDVRRDSIEAMSWSMVPFQRPFLGISWPGGVRGSQRASPSRVRRAAQAPPRVRTRAWQCRVGLCGCICSLSTPNTVLCSAWTSTQDSNARVLPPQQS